MLEGEGEGVVACLITALAVTTVRKAKRKAKVDFMRFILGFEFEEELKIVYEFLIYWR